jgi:hypothetical protein
MSEVVEKELLEVARKLPTAEFRAVVDFAEFLLARSASESAPGPRRRSKGLRDYIGGVRHGALTCGIDDELYGRPVR